MAKKTNLLGNLNLKALDSIEKTEEIVNKDLILGHFNFEFEIEENEILPNDFARLIRQGSAK